MTRYRYNYYLPGNTMTITGEVETTPEQDEGDATWMALDVLKDTLYGTINTDYFTIDAMPAGAAPLIPAFFRTPPRKPEEPEQ